MADLTPFKTPEDLSPETKQLYEVLNKEPDLPCVLLSAAFVDHCLASLLQSYLVDDKKSIGLLQPGRGLGEFSTRRNLCYCLGLITQELNDDLAQIGSVRNLFAHEFFSLGFADQRIIHKCNKLKADGLIPHFEELSGPPLVARARFTFAVVIAAGRLILTALSTTHRKRFGETDATNKSQQGNENT
jgi:DNA-binding MltR family transcriptional regulator